MTEADAYDGGTIEDLVRSVLEASNESARAYLRQSWITRAIEALGQLRRSAGLTQAEVADRLATTQSAIARLENDHGGGVSLRRFVEYALACDSSPFDVEFEAIGAMRSFAWRSPETPRTASVYSTAVGGVSSSECLTDQAHLQSTWLQGALPGGPTAALRGIMPQASWSISPVTVQEYMCAAPGMAESFGTGLGPRVAEQAVPSTGASGPTPGCDQPQAQPKILGPLAA